MRILIFVIAMSFAFMHSFSQTKKERSIISNANVDFIDNGIDYNLSFVPLAEFNQFSGNTYYPSNEAVEAAVRDALFSNGLEVGSYYQETQIDAATDNERTLYKTNVIDGDYLVKIKDVGGRSDISIEFISMDTNKMVARLSLSSGKIKFLSIAGKSHLGLFKYIFKDQLSKSIH